MPAFTGKAGAARRPNRSRFRCRLHGPPPHILWTHRQDAANIAKRSRISNQNSRSRRTVDGHPPIARVPGRQPQGWRRTFVGAQQKASPAARIRAGRLWRRRVRPGMGKSASAGRIPAATVADLRAAIPSPGSRDRQRRAYKVLASTPFLPYLSVASDCTELGARLGEYCRIEAPSTRGHLTARGGGAGYVPWPLITAG